ncbi:hypothetical protein [Nocardioides daejeonensis]|uniref:hypothetical protein n=1 Tax=Nocardioides daejeonensis TaxID=1046556 RepID=UPI000D74EB5A|nr:hypothetical protein [Nocardioides daejeonensis]
MDRGTWPERDHEWLDDYLAAVSQPNMASEAIEERTHEMLAALLTVDEAAESLFGPAEEVAADDVAEWGSEEVALEESLGSGWRSGLVFVGFNLLMADLVLTGILLLSHGWRIDVPVGAALITATCVGVLGAWSAALPLFEAGRPGWLATAIVTGAALMIGGVSLALAIDGERVLVDEAPCCWSV